jgi:hypothetical protein
LFLICSFLLFHGIDLRLHVQSNQRVFIRMWLLFCYLVALAHGSYDDPYGDDVWHVRLIDSYGANKLYRGGSPEVPESDYNDTAPFNWTALTKAMDKASPLPPVFRVLMVNLESLQYDNRSKDGGHVVRELEFFEKNPSKGSLVFWRIVGADTPYAPRLDASRMWLSKHFDMWDSDQLSVRIGMLHSYLRTNYSIPTMIYIHCDCGCDRTGQVSGAYVLKYLGWTWKDTVAYNNAVEPVPYVPPCMQCPNYWALTWFW